jgi:hypothetical protein
MLCCAAFVAQVLQMACQKYGEYITNLLALGVAAAYHFQRGLWSAKHSGQPLPRSEHAAMGCSGVECLHVALCPSS